MPDPVTIPTAGGGTAGGINPNQPPVQQVGNGNSPSNPNIIGGSLNFAGGGAGLFSGLSGDPATAMANLGPNYANAYESALSMNQQNYGNILTGYQQTMANQNQAQQKIQGGYGQLDTDVQGLIAGTDQAQLQANQDQYAANMGNMNQSAISRGLGNTTVTDALARGINLDKSKADTNTRNQFAQLQAGYKSNIGLAGLDYANQANLQNTALSGQQLGWMNSVTAPYPSAGQYGQLASQFGAAQQSAANQKAFQDQLSKLQNASKPGVTPGLNAGGGTGPQQKASTPQVGSVGNTPTMGNGAMNMAGGYGGNVPGASQAYMDALKAQGGLGGSGKPYAAQPGVNPATSKGGTAPPGGPNIQVKDPNSYMGGAASTAVGAGSNGYPYDSQGNYTGASDPLGYANAAANGGYYFDESGNLQYDASLDPASNSGYAWDDQGNATYDSTYDPSGGYDMAGWDPNVDASGGYNVPGNDYNTYGWDPNVDASGGYGGSSGYDLAGWDPNVDASGGYDTANAGAADNWLYYEE